MTTLQGPIALLSVYNKEGIVEFAQGLVDLGWTLLASGGTAKAIAAANIPVKDVAEIVGEPILGHRVVTLSREIHAGILAKDTPADHAELRRIGVPIIDLVCVDLYPLKDAIENDGGLEEIIELTDVGGPTLLHAAAKGQRIVICDTEDRKKVLEWLASRVPWESFRELLAAKAETYVANYLQQAADARWSHVNRRGVGPQNVTVRYGENPQQRDAMLRPDGASDPLALHRLRQIEGVPPSYVNFTDFDRLLMTMTHVAAAFDRGGEYDVPYIALAVKHGNACGAAVSTRRMKAVKDMCRGDSRAIFGGILMLNFAVDEEIARILMYEGQPKGKRRMLSAILAPEFTEGAQAALKTKNNKCLLFENEALRHLTAKSLDVRDRFRMVRGGVLRQPAYTHVLDISCARPEGQMPSIGIERDLLLAWAIGATSNSNTVTLVKRGMLIGNGVGQQDRVGCCELALKRAVDAGHEVRGAVAYSDSFFPFPDGPEVLCKAGVRAIFASSGSIRDDKVRATCAEFGVPLYSLPDGECRGFFGH